MGTLCGKLAWFGLWGVSAALLSVSLRAQGPRLITAVPFAVHDNRIVVEIFLEHQGPFRVIFDTGGANVITPEVRRRLGSKILAKGTQAGRGSEAARSRRERILVDTGDRSNLTVFRTFAAATGLDALFAKSGRLPSTRTGLFATTSLSASVGLGLLRAFDLEFDYQHKRLRLEPRAGFREESVFVPLPGPKVR
jgi:hypothetical protein